MMWANISHCPRKMAVNEQKNDSEMSVINSSGGEAGNSNGGFECMDSNSGKIYLLLGGKRFSFELTN